MAGLSASGGFHPQSRRAKHCLLSPELGLPQPLTRRRVCPPPLWFRGRDTLACGRGDGGVSIRTRGQTLWYSRYICFLCLRPSFSCLINIHRGPVLGFHRQTNLLRRYGTQYKESAELKRARKLEERLRVGITRLYFSLWVLFLKRLEPQILLIRLRKIRG